LGLQRGAGREARHFAARNRDPLARARVDALARAALSDVELAEAGETHVDGVAGRLLAADAIVACQLVKEFSLCHVEAPPSPWMGLKVGRNLTVAAGV